MKVSIIQSSYIPWKGYFDIIHDVDLFVFYDDIQYSKNSWRNRNKIKTVNGLKWLTIPVGGNENRLISEVTINDNKWANQHYQTIKMSYSKAPYFKKYKDFLEYVYFEKKWTYLYQLNRYIIEHISNDFLGIKTKFADSRDFPTIGVKHEKLLNLVKACCADTYLSGPSAKDYIISKDYTDNGINLEWKDYSGYPEYKQIFEPFEHFVSILDLLFNTGDDSPYYIWGWREDI
jgi:hypothetical protein